MPYAERTPQEVLDAISPIQVKRQDFALQSYFDDTLLNAALNFQPPGELIVPSTRQVVSSPCFGLALHPASQTPIAVRFQGGMEAQQSQTYILAPGQVVRPAIRFPFPGFSWGLPRGWLGGGSAYLIVLKAPDAEVAWPRERPEIVYHRFRMPITAQAAIAANSFLLGLPFRFPWPFAPTTANSGGQTSTSAASAVIALEPTRLQMKLRLTSLAAAVDMRVLVKNSMQWDQNGGTPGGINPDGTTATASALSGEIEGVDVTWPAGSALADAVFPVLEILNPWARLVGDNASIALSDLGNATLTTQKVDICQIGRL